ncbi:hypothetical protein [Streptomyces sp. NPDC048419]|uniref:hypothetical protein n=1 Tax=Streptomyces sp. NPDC048419 TaxID=3365547 RepID=UPI0037156D59
MLVGEDASALAVAEAVERAVDLQGEVGDVQVDGHAAHRVEDGAGRQVGGGHVGDGVAVRGGHVLDQVETAHGASTHPEAALGDADDVDQGVRLVAEPVGVAAGRRLGLGEGLGETVDGVGAHLLAPGGRCVDPDQVAGRVRRVDRVTVAGDPGGRFVDEDLGESAC